VNLSYQAEKICEIFGPVCDEIESLIFELHSESTAQMKPCLSGCCTTPSATGAVRRKGRAAYTPR
jgi:hypothetical protein